MRLCFNRRLFPQWRRLAVIHQSDMRLGETFWCTNGRHFTLIGWTSEMQYITRLGLNIPGSSAMNIAVSIDGSIHRLDKMNVDALGTPWLIFRDEAMRDACRLSMPVTIDTIDPVW